MPTILPGHNVALGSPTTLYVASGAGGNDALAVLSLDPITGAVNPGPTVLALPGGFDANSAVFAGYTVTLGGATQLTNSNTRTGVSPFFPELITRPVRVASGGSGPWTTTGDAILGPAMPLLLGKLKPIDQLAVDPSGAYLYGVTEAGLLDVIAVTAVVGTITTTNASQAPWSFNKLSPFPPVDPGLWTNGLAPTGMVVDPSGTCLYTIQSDGKGASSIAAFPMLDRATPSATPLVVSGGASSDFEGLALDATGQLLVVADVLNNRVTAFQVSIAQAWTPNAQPTLTRLASFGDATSLPSPRCVAFNRGGPVCYVTAQPATGTPTVRALRVDASGFTPINNGPLQTGLPSVPLNPGDRPTAIVVAQ
jgi:hypothetical protein